MSYTRIDVDIREMVDELNLTGKKLLVEYLKEELGEEFETPLAEEDKKRLGLLDVEVEVDTDEVINDLSHWERKDLYNDLHDEFGEDCECNEDSPFGGGTYSEEEFGKVLTKLWEDRWMLSNEQKARIEAITKESFV